MSRTFQVGDLLPPLGTRQPPFSCSATARSPGTRTASTSTKPMHARGPRGLALHSHLRAALALRCVTEGLGPGWQVTKVSYRLRKPVYAPAELAYTARVTAAEGDSLTLELIEENPSGEVGLEKHGVGQQDHGRPPAGGSCRQREHNDNGSRTRAASHPHRELLGLLRRPGLGHGRHGQGRRHRRPDR